MKPTCLAWCTNGLLTFYFVGDMITVAKKKRSRDASFFVPSGGGFSDPFTPPCVHRAFKKIASLTVEGKFLASLISFYSSHCILAENIFRIMIIFLNACPTTSTAVDSPIVFIITPFFCLILFFEFNFFFCFFVNIHLILNINFINKPASYHTKLHKLINVVNSIHFF